MGGQAAPDRQAEAEEWIRRLGLFGIDLGGYFGPAFRSDEVTLDAALPERFRGDRSLYSSNYYLLKAGQVLGLHTLHQDELWFHHQGVGIRLYLFSQAGDYRSVTVGPDWHQGEVLQGIARRGDWFGAEVLTSDDGTAFSLCSCSLSPGHDPRDSVQPKRKQVKALQKQFPEQATLIARLASVDV